MTGLRNFIFSVLAATLLLPFSIYSQDTIQDLQNEISVLTKIKYELTDSLSGVESKIDSLNELIFSTELEQLKESDVILTISRDIVLRSEPSVLGKELINLKPGDEVILLNFDESNYIEVRRGNTTGFLNTMFVKEKDVVDSLIKAERDKRNQLRKRLLDLERKIQSDMRWASPETTNVRSAPENSARIVHEIEKGQEVFVQDQDGDWYLVYFKHDYRTQPAWHESEEALIEFYSKGWVLKDQISDDFVAEISQYDIMRRQREETITNRRQNYVNQNPGLLSSIKQNILKGNVQIGMTKNDVIASWGEPRDINRTVTSTVVREQWVYGQTNNRRYLYFNNGVLDSFQD